MSSPLPPTDHFFNRELSWIEFNARVLAEAMDSANPLLERLKFSGIVSSNFDEFFMVRIASLASDDPLAAAIRRNAYDLIRKQYDHFQSALLPELATNKIRRVLPQELNEKQTEHIRSMFRRELFPVLTPIALAKDRPMPAFVNLSLYLLVSLVGSEASPNRYWAAIEIPRNFPRIIDLRDEEQYAFILLEDVVALFAQELFRGYGIAEHGVLRVTRAADMSLDEEKDEDFLRMMEEALKTRKQGGVVRLEIQGSDELVEFAKSNLNLSDEDVIRLDGWLDLKSISALALQPRFEHLGRAEWAPKLQPAFENDENIWTAIREHDFIVHHPYESFECINRLLDAASRDPDVLAIKQTLYRIGQDSPIVRSLERAAENGKRVTVLVELKARFDEGSNIEWAKRLERSGASILYGVAGFKTHAKACLIVRREADGIKRYVHLATGNYNVKTTRQYSDLGLLTAQDDFGDDLSAFFNMITGYSQPVAWKKIEVAPYGLRRRLIRLILREAMRMRDGRGGFIMAKMNSLVDPDIIEALYKTSQVGVQIKLNVRGVCCLKPGVPGLSDTIEVMSIVDMFLEHARMFYFENGGDSELFLSSADWMPRNFDRRIELMFPIENKKTKSELSELLKSYFRDNIKSWQLQPDGTYRKREEDSKKKFRVQEFLLQRAIERDNLASKALPLEMKPQKPKSTG